MVRMLNGRRHCLPRSCKSSSASPILSCEVKEEHGSYENLDEESKRGPCLSELRRAGMTQWISCQPVTLDAFEQHEEIKPRVSSNILESGCEIEQDEYEAAMVGESHVTQENLKRKRFMHGPIEEVKANGRGKRRGIGRNRKQITHERSQNRWSAERYKLAEQSMFEILKAERAVFGNPISRPALRVAARKRIGDTGLLDHLLKHIDGEVAPGGAERFRRCHNTHGTMVYWLESANLVDIQQQAREQDPVYNELKLLQAEMTNMKNDMQELASRKQEQDHSKQIEELREELVNWKAKIEQYQIGISNSLSSMQDMYRELLVWKTKTDQKLVEVSNTLSSMQASKQSNGLSPLASERWEDWLESTNLDNVQEEDLVPWLGSSNLVNTEQEAAVQGTCSPLPPQLKADGNPTQAFVCAKELELLKEEMAKMKRDVQGMVLKKHDEDQANLTPDSSALTTSKLDLDSSFLLFQDMCNELVKWKANMEQQLMEIASGMQASKHVGHTFKLSSFERWN